MGQCESTGMSRSYGVTEDNLKNLAIGQELEIDKGCGTAISGMQAGSGYDWLVKRGFSFPDNGEFQWAGLGSQCQMCSNAVSGYGCDNCSGSKAITGKRGKIKRISFSGSKTNCCKMPNSKIIDNKTCDPTYQTHYQTADCDDVMQSYCQGDVLDSYPSECKQWIHTSLDSGRSSPNTNLKNYCSQGTNYTKAVCQEWVDKIKNISGMQGEADQVIKTYCENNPSDENCTCLKPPENVSKVENLMASPKVCWYKPCKSANENYLTSTMRTDRGQCVNTTCYIEAGDITVSGDGNKVNFSNDCATNLLKDTSTGTTTDTTDATDTTDKITDTTDTTGKNTDTTTNNTGKTTDTDTTTDTTTTSSSSSKYIIIGGGVLLLCSCCIIIIIVIIVIIAMM